MTFHLQTLAAAKVLARGKDDPGTEKFLDYFYKYCIETLFKPFSDVPEYKHLTGELRASTFVAGETNTMDRTYALPDTGESQSLRLLMRHAVQFRASTLISKSFLHPLIQHHPACRLVID